MILLKLKEFNFWYINKKWTIKSQILIASLLIWTFIFISLLLITFLVQQYIQSSLEQISSQIFISQTSEQLNNIWIFQSSMSRMFQYTKHQVTSTQTIYKYFSGIIQSSGEGYYFQWPQMCLNNQSEVDTYCFNSSTTCGIFGIYPDQLHVSELETVAATANILTEFRVALDHTNQAPMYFFKDDAYQFYCITTGIPFPNTFVPNQRPYYLEFLKMAKTQDQFSEIYFASPYKVVSGKIKIPLMTGLFNSSNQFIGLVAKDIDFGYASVAQSQFQNFTIYVIDDNGKIFYSQLYNKIYLTVHFFNDTNFTGFNQTDLAQIEKQYNNLPFENNCDNFQFLEILCRKKLTTGENLIIKSQKITDSQLILLLIIDTNLIFKQNEDHKNLNQYYYRKAIIQSIVSVLVMPLCLIIISSIIIGLILRQLDGLIKMVYGKLCPNSKESYLYQICKPNQVFDSKSVSGLITAINQLFQNHFNKGKSDECLIQEKFSYPKYPKQVLKLYLKKMKEPIDSFANQQQNNEKEFSIGQIFRQYC